MDKGLVVALGLFVAVSAQAEVYSGLDQALKVATDKSPAILQAKSHLDDLEAQTAKAFAGIYPVINFVGTATEKKDAVTVGGAAYGGNSYDVYNAQFQLKQTVWDGGTILGTYSGAKKERAQADDALRIAERDLKLAVIKAYYGVVFNQSQVQSLQQNEKIQREALDVAEHRYKIGRGQLLDVLQIKTQLALSTSKIANAQTQLTLARKTLTALVAPDGKGEELADVKDQLKLLDWEKIRGRHVSWITSTPELNRAISLADEVGDKKWVTMAAHYPQIYLNGAWGRTSNRKMDLTNDAATFWSAQLSLTIPLFSGLTSFRDRESFAAQQAQADQTVVSTRQSDSVNLTSAEENAKLNWQQVKILGETYHLAQESFAEAKRNYKYATIDYLQFLTVEQNLLDSEISWNQAKLNAISAVGDWFKAAGISMDGYLAELGDKK